MKAIFCTAYGPPEVLQLREVEIPVPGDNEVLVKVYATTVTAADFRIRSFTVPPSFWLPARIALGLRKPKKPILGVELSGEIVAVGKNVSTFGNGDQVFAATLTDFGAYAEYTCLPAFGPMAIKPANITHEEAAAIPIGARTALHFLRKGGVAGGAGDRTDRKKVLIYGASGSVGTYAVQLARHFDAEVTGVCSSANLDLVESLGAEKVIDYTERDFTQKLGMYDVIFLAVDKFPFTVCKRFLKENGVYVNITSPFKNVQMLWIAMTSNRKIIVGHNPPETAEDLAFLKKLVEDGVIRPVIDRRYPIEQIVEAHRYVDQGHKKGNVVITVSPVPGLE